MKLTPVASGVTDTQEDWLVFFFGFLQCFFVPGIPVNWVIGVLEEIGALFADKAIGGFVCSFHKTSVIYYEIYSRNIFYQLIMK